MQIVIFQSAKAADAKLAIRLSYTPGVVNAFVKVSDPFLNFHTLQIGFLLTLQILNGKENFPTFQSSTDSVEIWIVSIASDCEYSQ